MNEQEKGKPSDKFKEFTFKCRQARERLGTEFLAFLKVSDSLSYFICGGNGATEFFQGPTFGARIIGATTREVREIESVLERMEEETVSELSPIDFHASLASQMLSSYLEQVTYDEDLPQATAAAVMFFDLFGNLTVLEFSGDYETYELEGVKQNVFLTACYDAAKRRLVLKVLESILKLKKPNEKIVAKLCLVLQKKLKLKYLQVAEIETSFDDDEDADDSV